MKDSKVVGKVYETTNYDMFSLRPDNRLIDEDNVKSKMNSIKTIGQQIPIQVDENFVIQDGQHRREACKRMGEPLTFIISNEEALNTTELALLQSSTKGWTWLDYAHSFSTNGENMQEYKTYNMFSKLYPEYVHSVILLLLMNAKTRTGTADILFKSGRFKVKSYTLAKKNADIIKQMAPFYSRYYKRNFVLAMMILISNPEFDLSRLLRKMPKRCKEIMDFSRKEDYVNTLQHIYNWKETKKVYFQ